MNSGKRATAGVIIGLGVALGLLRLPIGLKYPVLGTVLAVINLLLVGTGCCFYLKAKGQQPLWGLLGLLPPSGLLGLFVAFIAPDVTGTAYGQNLKQNKK